MQEIADEAGINKAMLHYYFRSKEKLYHAIVIETLGQIIPKLAAALKQEGSLWERIERVVNTYIDTLVDNPDIPFFIMSELSQKRERFVLELKQRAQYFPAIKGLLMQITQEIQAGNIKPIPPLHLILNIMGMTIFPFMAKPVFCTILDFPEQDFGELMEERKVVIVEFLKSALRVD